MWSYFAAVPAVIVAASFANTINLGAILVAILLVLGFAWASRKDKRAERWEKLYDLADSERKEVQEKLDTAMATVKEQKDVIAKLDAMQMPIKIVEMMNDSVARIDDASNQRLGSAMQQVMKGFEQHEDHAHERHLAMVELMGELVRAVTQLSIRVEDNK